LKSALTALGMKLFLTAYLPSWILRGRWQT